MSGLFAKLFKRKTKMSSPKTTIIVGAGMRGSGYPYYAKIYPDQLKVVGVCEPREYYRNHAIETHEIPAENVFTDWKEAAEKEKFADSVMICTPDKLHKDPAVAFAEKGYHILLEKPMATTEEDCREIVKTCQENGVLLSVCHVLRYTPWVKKVKEIIDSGIIGDVVNINHTEPVGFDHFPHSYVRGNWHNERDSSFSLLAKCCHDFDLINYWMGKPCEKVSSMGHLSHFNQKGKVGFWHFAHSFVRGNWRNENESSFSLLAKCCHDVDLLCYWMSGKTCERVSSFGSLSHFNSNAKPKGAASRCLDCPDQVEANCPYSAKKIYLDPAKRGSKGWPVGVICEVVDIENVTDALRNGPYGKCVYDTDNDVMSQQIVNMQFEGGATATLTMVAFTKKLCEREVKIYGTMGEITVNDGDIVPIQVYEFNTRKTVACQVEDEAVPASLGGHDGADFHCVRAFVNGLHDPDNASIETGPENTLASHVLCFAAERARKENRVLCRSADGQFV